MASEGQAGASCCGGGAAAMGVIDPVCGMTVDPSAGRPTHVYEGKTYHFCCEGCRGQFAADPKSFLEPRPKSPARRPARPMAHGHAPAGHAAPKPTVSSVPLAGPPDAPVYTCPMHPEVRQRGPGSCPICGMALEPETVSLDDGPNPELADMTRRLWIAAALTLPVFVLEMGGHALGLHGWIAPRSSAWVQLVLATPVVLALGWPFFVRAWASLVSRHLNMFTLIAIGTGVAWAYSLVATLAPQLFPAAMRAPDGSVAIYFEAAAVITVLVLLGQVLELRARERTSGAIRGLLDLSPKRARRIAADGTEADVDVAEVAVGDRLRLRPGERVPVDGVVVEGEGHVDESMVTGEPLPAGKSAGARLIAGTLSQSGGLVMRAEKIGRDTMLSQIVQMVAEAQRSRAPIQRLADRVAGWFVPAVLAVAVLAFLAWITWGPEPRFTFALVAAVSVLIIACPCALGLATPMSIMVGVGRGARAGVLVRDAAALERLEAVDTLVIDKTGTLTEGRPSVVAVRPLGGWPEADLVRLTAGLEAGSEHPLAAAILAHARAKALNIPPVSGFAAVTGAGARGSVEGRRVLAGNRRLMEAEGVDVAGFGPESVGPGPAEATRVLIAIDGEPAGVLAIADPVRPGAAETMRALEARGLGIVMLTGDARPAAEAVAGRLGIRDFQAGLLPADKARAVERLKREGRVVAMAGDGINDAPALAAADVGIAMGTGTDVAIESAGVTLLHGDLKALLAARRLAEATMRNIRQNLAFAFLYNAAGVPIAAGVLYPALGWLLSPMLAAAAMSLSSVSVIANALRLARQRL